jgi:S-layer homology domain
MIFNSKECEGERAMKVLQFKNPLSVFQVRRLGLLLASIAAVALFSGGCCKLVPWALAVDPSLTGTSDANGMLEPGETVVVAPTWSKHNTGRCKFIGGKLVCTGTPQPGEFSCYPTIVETGTAASLTGSTPGDYVIGDNAASYGTIGATLGGTKQCTDCYAMFVSAPAGRPTPHWDASFTENLSGTRFAEKTWTLHIGDSFTDVPRAHPFYKKIETLFHNGITTGCSQGVYCPDADVSRANMAIFLARAIARGDANVPFSGTLNGAPYSCAAGGTSLFTDIAPADSFCRHVHYVATQNVTLGCGPSLYCPDDLVSRLQMAALVAKAIVAPGGGAAVPQTFGSIYSCDPASPNVHFTDVPATGPFCKHVHFLWARGVVAGCGPDTFCPDGDVARDQMAKFIVNAFNLQLYGP